MSDPTLDDDADRQAAYLDDTLRALTGAMVALGLDYDPSRPLVEMVQALRAAATTPAAQLAEIDDIVGPDVQISADGTTAPVDTPIVERVRHLAATVSAEAAEADRLRAVIAAAGLADDNTPKEQP